MTAKQGFWMSTFTGRRVYPLDLNTEDFCIEDIAHGLSNICRFGGQVCAFYSVAEHSVRASKRAEAAYGRSIGLTMLLHDAAEAYVGDAVRPICEILTDYCTLRDRMQEVINIKFGLDRLAHLTPEVTEVDSRMLVTEASVMYLHEDRWWEQTRLPLPYSDEWVMFRNKERVSAPGATVTKATNAKLFDNQFWNPRMAKRLFLERFKELQG